jgi:hypothetical protein
MRSRGLVWLAGIMLCAAFWLAVAVAAGAPPPW